MKSNQGSVVIYIVLLIFLLMTSSAIVLTTILSKHIRAAENYVISEQVFSAANSSIESMMYEVMKNSAKGKITSSGTVEYDNDIKVSYKGSGCGKTSAGGITAHLSASGSYKDLVRKIDFGGGSGGCP